MSFLRKVLAICTIFAAPYLSFGAVINIPSSQIGTPHRRTYFYVGQVYVPAGPNAVNPSSIADGQMYVEHLVPQRVTQPLPILFIHGHAMTGTNLLNTPDGRPGWADYFLSKGYELYIVDQPARARSAYQSDYDGAQDVYDTFTVEERFTATQRIKAWPKAILHTQWPGNGSVGDPVFDAFYAASVPSLHSDTVASLKIKAASVPLLDKIGPVILLTHSQSGPFGWILGDARPTQIKGIVAIEPVGPPFQNAGTLGTAAARPWGVTEIPLAYQPSAPTPDSIARQIFEQIPSLNYTCWQQVEPTRKLFNLAKVPVLMITSESGEHSNYDGCTARYLTQAGVSVKHVRLEDVGIHGNGHMMFMEKNSDEIVSKVVEPWIAGISGV